MTTDCTYCLHCGYQTLRDGYDHCRLCGWSDDFDPVEYAEMHDPDEAALAAQEAGCYD